MSELKEMTNARMHKFFPEALERALLNYRRASHKSERDYMKIKQQQDACKVGIAHIQLLLKLGRELTDEAKGVGGAEMEHEDLHQLIKNAQDEISGV